MSTEHELETLHRMLREMADIAEEASLTGGLSGGQVRLASHYNSLLSRVEETGRIGAGLFQPLDEQSIDYGQIAVEARLLSSAIWDRKGKGKSKDGFGWLCGIAPFMDADDLGALVEEKLKAGMDISESMLPALAPFLSSETLGRIVRAGIKETRERPVEPEPPTAPERPQARPPEPAPVAETRIVASDSHNEIHRLAMRLADPNVGPEESEEIRRQIGRLALEQ